MCTEYIFVELECMVYLEGHSSKKSSLANCFLVSFFVLRLSFFFDGAC
jgi:hypothetical protein